MLPVVVGWLKKEATTINAPGKVAPANFDNTLANLGSGSGIGASATARAGAPGSLRGLDGISATAKAWGENPVSSSGGSTPTPAATPQVVKPTTSTTPMSAPSGVMTGQLGASAAKPVEPTSSSATGTSAQPTNMSFLQKYDNWSQDKPSFWGAVNNPEKFEVPQPAQNDGGLVGMPAIPAGSNQRGELPKQDDGGLIGLKALPSNSVVRPGENPAPPSQSIPTIAPASAAPPAPKLISSTPTITNTSASANTGTYPSQSYPTTTPIQTRAVQSPYSSYRQDNAIASRTPEQSDAFSRQSNEDSYWARKALESRNPYLLQGKPGALQYYNQLKTQQQQQNISRGRISDPRLTDFRSEAEKYFMNGLPLPETADPGVKDYYNRLMGHLHH